MHLQRKRGSADLNLVPYIDLLTCMIAFLLITAVWTQLAQLPLKHAAGGTGDFMGIAEPPPVSLVVTEEGFNVVIQREGHPVPRSADGYDFAALARALNEAKSAHPDQEELRVSSADAVRFETLVTTMDTALAAGFSGVSLLDDGPVGL